MTVEVISYDEMYKCGCELPENSKFCFACGAKLEENCVEAQKKELAENFGTGRLSGNEGDERRQFSLVQK